jgi:hypothetical protein
MATGASYQEKSSWVLMRRSETRISASVSFFLGHDRGNRSEQALSSPLSSHTVAFQLEWQPVIRRRRKAA